MKSHTDADLIAVWQALSAEQSRSGEAIAASLGISRAVLWKRIESLRGLGVEIDAQAGAGYRCLRAPDLLDAVALRASLHPASAEAIDHLDCVLQTGSTNEDLRRASAQLPRSALRLAECQHAGRGRRGRSFVSPVAAGFLGSLFWRLDCGLSELGGLSLAVGVAVAESLRALGAPVQVKWPNDLVIADQKLGGLLIEAGGEFHGPCFVVIGLGVNLDWPDQALTSIDQPVTDLRRHLTHWPGRRIIVARIVDALVEAMGQFAREAFLPFQARFAALDGLAGREVRVLAAAGEVIGLAQGIDVRGRLLVRTTEGTQTFDSAEVSVRPSV